MSSASLTDVCFEAIRTETGDGFPMSEALHKAIGGRDGRSEMTRPGMMGRSELLASSVAEARHSSWGISQDLVLHSPHRALWADLSVSLRSDVVSYIGYSKCFINRDC